MTIEEIKEAIRRRHYIVVFHAFEEAEEDRLHISDVFNSVVHGEVIENYPDRKPYPRCLVLGFTGNGIPVHTVWEDDQAAGRAVLITVYRPKAADWLEWRRRR